MISRSRNPEKKLQRLPYKDQDGNAAKALVAGVIFETDVDRSHPLAAGIPRDRLPVFRAQADVYRQAILTAQLQPTLAPVISGYVV